MKSPEYDGFLVNAPDQTVHPFGKEEIADQGRRYEQDEKRIDLCQHIAGDGHRSRLGEDGPDIVNGG